MNGFFEVLGIVGGVCIAVGLLLNGFRGEAKGTIITALSTNRMQIWLFRGAMVGVIVLFLILNFVGSDVTSVSNGSVTTYSRSPMGSVFFGAMGILVGVVALAYWMKSGRFFRLLGIALGVIAIYSLFMTPTGLDHRLVVTPDYFRHRIGSWYSPIETKVDFGSLAYVGVKRTKGGNRQNQTYELQCFTKRGETISIPISDLMKEALPEVLRRAAQSNVIIGQNADGLQIPSDLRKRPNASTSE